MFYSILFIVLLGLLRIFSETARILSTIIISIIAFFIVPEIIYLLIIILLLRSDGGSYSLYRDGLITLVSTLLFGQLIYRLTTL